MKILQLVNGLDIGAKSGGAAHFALELSQFLQNTGEQVGIAVLYRFQTDAERFWESALTARDIQINYLNDGPHLNLVAAFRHLKQLCSTREIQIIHSHTPVGSLLAILVKWQLGVLRVLRTEHTPLPWGRGFAGAVCRFLFTNFLFPACLDGEVGVSQPITTMLNRRLIARVFHRQASLIPPVLPEVYLRRIGGNAKGEPENKAFVLGSVGILRDIKRVDVLIKAMPAVLIKYPAAQLILVGGGDEREHLEALAAELHVQRSVHFLGPRKDVSEQLERMDLFVLPSQVEGLPTVILESWACGVPVIAADIPGTRALITNEANGWLVPVCDSHALAEKINFVLSEPGLRARARANAYEAVSAFTLQQVGPAYLELYRKMIR